MKEIEDDTRNGMIFYALGLEELILLKWSYYPKQSTDLMQSLLKIPRTFFIELKQIIIKFIWNHKKTLNYQNNPEKKAEGITLTDFRIYNKTTIIETAWY